MRAASNRPDTCLHPTERTSAKEIPCAVGFRKQILEKATEDAVGAVRRPHESTAATEVVGSRPKPPQAMARSASLDASAAVDHP